MEHYNDENVYSPERLETRVRVSGVPVNAHPDELTSLLQTVGEVTKSEKYESRDGQTQVVHVTFSTAESARDAAQRLNGASMDGGHTIRVDRLVDRRSRVPRSQQGGGRGGIMTGGGGMGGIQHRHAAEFPLRILVLSEMVGAIIGRQGATIRAITQQSRARVDVHRKDNAGSLEKAITIYGNPENCTSACKRILEVMQEESDKTNKGGEVSLKILAHNNLIGRIIGKGGATIKKIMEDTNTKITVSSVNDINSFNLERIITIKGSIDDIAKAENAVSAKLRQSYESDLQSFAPQSSMFPGLHPMAMMSTVGSGGPRGDRGGMNSMGPMHGGPGMYGGGSGNGSSLGYTPMYPAPFSSGSYSDNCEETAFLYIPNYSVGAIIGTKGSHIRNIIRFSGASVKIAAQESAPQDNMNMTDVPERKVTVVGTPEAQWKAQYLIFEKIREEYAFGYDDVKLTVEVLIPSSQVGRLIGKGGQNVRDLQRQTGASIKLPQLGATQDEETTVQIMGQFYAVQSAQRRIRSMVQSSVAPPYMMGGGRRSGSPRGMMTQQ
ncbi:insulin-like growth factor 2 mRNA-binding protein 2 isoform X2 [Hyalella azteca]|uniref:Insulin-like growth factor 2 mRNA-binding protein 2 isoform X2 n=1 Tax=Hyalella azteca TaxID=294128 RepID=A0A8B7PEP9_HYAAZ|nr:insulin-like growth factor 2 mRNA-binding protein 2 isoform X2 [Hyalella azteca]